MKIICGIDISSEWVDASLDGKKAKQFKSTLAGFAELVRWAKGCDLFVMEATGRYHEALADYLCQNKLPVAVVNPARASHYARAMGLANKTDASDAAMLARYAQSNEVPQYIPRTASERTFQDRVRARGNLARSCARIKTQMKTPGSDAFIQDLNKKHLKFLQAQIKELDKQIEKHLSEQKELAAKAELLRTIPGVGPIATYTILSEVRFELFDKPKALSAFAGTNPREFKSGKSVRKETRMSKRGNVQLRSALYMCALSAIRFEPFRTFYVGLVKEGKSKKSALGAVMNKLARVIFGVMKGEAKFVCPAT